MPARGKLPAQRITAMGAPAGQLRGLAEERIAEARILLKANKVSGAAYIVGYGVELHLKAIIAERSYAGFWPPVEMASDLHHHNLEILLRQAGLTDALRRAGKDNTELEVNWATARRWSPSFRYQRLRAVVAEDMVDAVAHERHGVAQWLRRR